MVKPTMKYIATMAGVSQPTVSKVLNGKYVDIKKSTRERVLRVVKQLNYQPDYMASTLRSRSRRCLGVAGNASLGEMADPYASRIYAGVGSVAGIRGHGVTFFPANLDDDDNELLKAAQSGMVDGLIILLYSRQYVSFKTTTLPRLVRGRMPFAVVHFTGHLLECNNVGFDAAAGAETAARHLVDRGYRNVAVIRDNREHGDEYAAGYRRVMDERHRPVRDIVLPVAYRSDEDYVREFERIVYEYPDYDGFVTTSYQAAHGLGEAVRRSGKRIGKDIGIVAGSNPTKRSMFGLGITAIDEQYEERGRLAAEMVYSTTGSENMLSTPHKQQLLQPELIERASTERKYT